MPHLTDGIVTLREYRKEDGEPMLRWYADERVTSSLSDIFLRNHTADSRDGFLSMVMNNQSNDLWFIISRADSLEYLGQVDITAIDWVNRCGTLGIVIGSPDNFNKGYGTRALKLIVDYAFRRAGLHKVNLSVYDFNPGGMRAYEKAGFVQEGRLKDQIWRNGRWHDVILMAAFSPYSM